MDSMVRTAMAIEREIEDAQSIQDEGTSGKRRESQFSSSLGKKPKASSSRGFQGQGRGHQGQGQIRASSQAGSLTCFHCHLPGHVRRDYPQNRDPMAMGNLSPSHQWDRRGHSLFLHTLVLVRGISTNPRVLHRHLPLHRQVRGARVWVEAEDRAHKLGHQGPRGLSTPSYHRLSQ